MLLLHIGKLGANSTHGLAIQVHNHNIAKAVNAPLTVQILLQLFCIELHGAVAHCFRNTMQANGVSMELLGNAADALLAQLSHLGLGFLAGIIGNNLIKAARNQHQDYNRY